MEENSAEQHTVSEHKRSPRHEESPSDAFQPSTDSTAYRQVYQEFPCQCEQCTARYGRPYVKMDEDSEQSTLPERLEVPTPSDEQLSTSSTTSVQSPCNCEQCVSKYGALPLLADAVDRTASGSGLSYQSSSPTHEASSESQQSASETTGPIRGSKKRIFCEFCGKVFGHTGDLNKHRRKHTGERPYPCSQCSKCFSHASNLLRHQKIHSGEMPHECPVCAKKFSRKDKMMNHVKNSHKASSEPLS